MATTFKRVNPYVGLGDQTIALLDSVGSTMSATPTLDELYVLMSQYIKLEDATSDVSPLNLTILSYAKVASVLNCAQDSVAIGENDDILEELVNFPPLATSTLVNAFLNDLESRVYIKKAQEEEMDSGNEGWRYLLSSIQVGKTLSEYWQAQITAGGSSDWATQVAGGFDYRWVKDGIRGILVIKDRDHDNSQLLSAGAGFSMLRILGLL